FSMSSTPDWLDGLIINKDTLVSKLESVGFLDTAFVRKVENDLGSGIDAVMRAMNDIERLENQLNTSEEESVAVLTKQFLKEHGVIPDEDLKTAVEAPKTVLNNIIIQTPRAEKTANMASRQAEEREKEGEAVTPLTPDDLESVPKYMKGRIALSEIVRVLSAFLKYKHELLGANVNKLSVKEKDLVYNWKNQGSDTSTTFCLDTELRERLPEKCKKNLKTVLPILRHVRKIREARDKGAMRIYPLS
ncbi:hypothetical protein PENTCL1PPCAC_1611, partial [Pristionchus entomophagus]